MHIWMQMHGLTICTTMLNGWYQRQNQRCFPVWLPLFVHMLKLQGVPKTIVSDRVAKLSSHFWKTLWSKMGTKLLFSTSCHPQIDGQTEVANRTVGAFLRSRLSSNVRMWEEDLPVTKHWVCLQLSHTLGQQEVLLRGRYGRNPITPLDLVPTQDIVCFLTIRLYWCSI